MEDFKTLPSNNINGSIQYEYTSSNGYGASIVRHSFSYGASSGLWELAVIDLKTDELCYDTPITNDVLGYLTEQDVMDTLKKIDELPSILEPA